MFDVNTFSPHLLPHSPFRLVSSEFFFSLVFFLSWRFVFVSFHVAIHEIVFFRLHIKTHGNSDDMTIHNNSLCTLFHSNFQEEERGGEGEK